MYKKLEYPEIQKRPHQAYFTFFIWAFRRGGSTNLHRRPEQPHSITHNR